MAVGQDGLGGHTTLVGLGFSVGPVQTAREIHDCPQLAARHAFVEVDVGGKHIKAPGAPVRMFDTESRADTRGPPSANTRMRCSSDCLGTAKSS